MLWEDVRKYALDQIDPNVSEDAKASATKAVDDALYGLMMVVDGVTGGLRNSSARASLTLSVRYEAEGQTEVIDLSQGDGMCMGYHYWKAGDFGDAPIVEPRRES
jgi:hypothetical protein